MTSDFSEISLPTIEKKTISYRDIKKIYLDKFKVDLQLSPLGLKDLQNEGENDLDQLVLLYRATISTFFSFLNYLFKVG